MHFHWEREFYVCIQLFMQMTFEISWVWIPIAIIQYSILHVNIVLVCIFRIHCMHVHSEYPWIHTVILCIWKLESIRIMHVS